MMSLQGVAYGRTRFRHTDGRVGYITEIRSQVETSIEGRAYRCITKTYAKLIWTVRTAAMEWIGKRGDEPEYGRCFEWVPLADLTQEDA